MLTAFGGGRQTSSYDFIIELICSRHHSNTNWLEAHYFLFENDARTDVIETATWDDLFNYRFPLNWDFILFSIKTPKFPWVLKETLLFIFRYYAIIFPMSNQNKWLTTKSQYILIIGWLLAILWAFVPNTEIKEYQWNNETYLDCVPDDELYNSRWFVWNIHYMK